MSKTGYVCIKNIRKRSNDAIGNTGVGQDGGTRRTNVNTVSLC